MTSLQAAQNAYLQHRENVKRLMGVTDGTEQQEEPLKALLDAHEAFLKVRGS